MKLYLISHRVLQKVLELIYEDTRHLSIKRSNIGQYLKMKEEMVAILANEELFMKQLEMINEQQRTRLQSTKVIVRSCEKNSGVKRIYFANERKQE